MGQSPQGERLEFNSSQITSPLNEPVYFLKSLNADVCELASSVGKELRAHSGLRRMETWNSLRMMSDKASVFETVSTQILSLALEFVTLRSPGRACLESSWGSPVLQLWSWLVYSSKVDREAIMMIVFITFNSRLPLIDYGSDFSESGLFRV